MNQTRFEEAFCGKVPLNQTNLIQPHGVLLVVDRNHFNVIQSSENAPQVFGKEARDIVGKPLDALIGEEAATQLQQRIQQPASGKFPIPFEVSGKHFLALVSNTERYFIMEITAETAPGTGNSFVGIYATLKYVIEEIEKAGTTEQTCAIAIRELKRISGFDKVMLYRFDQDWNGDVIAEVKNEGMESYLGLKFPASDIPAQARELYRRTPYRLIPNRVYDPVRLYPVLNPVTHAFTDLSDSNLRSVAGVHLEYLANMGVTASMSTRILVDDKLWGLIACHGLQPRYLSYETCSIFEWISTVISAKISAVQRQDADAFRSKLRLLYTGIIEDVYREGGLVEGLRRNEAALHGLLGTDRIAIVADYQIETLGDTPSDEDIENLVLWLRSAGYDEVWHQPSLSSVFEPAEAYSAKASGVLVLPLAKEKNAYLIGFRPEAERQVNWGGNPAEAVQFEANGKNYHPRNSFRQWQQTVRHTSEPWSVEQIEISEELRRFLAGATMYKMQG